MRVLADFVRPEQYEVELTVRMTVGEWECIASELTEKHPSWMFASQIRDVIAKVKTRVYGELPKAD